MNTGHGGGIESAVMPRLLVIALSLCAASPAAAQSLFIAQGERAVEGSAGWSVGPFSNGLELHGAVSPDGRWDIGLGFDLYSADFGGEDDTTFTEWSPSVRYFIFKESDDSTVVSFALQAALFQQDFDGDDEGWYALAGGQLFKRLELAKGFAFYPYVGFSLAAESFSFGGREAEYSVYLTRQFGIHTLMSLTDDAWLRVTAEEHGFRRETYRAARVAMVVRF
jgi:hypothetical protein